MIERLEGTVVHAAGGLLHLRVGPLTLELQVPASAGSPAPEPGRILGLFTHLQWKQDEGPVLFGFASSEERRVFRLLLQVQGIGPRIALAILGHLSPAQLVDRILARDEAVFTLVPGVGRKTAGRILVELGPQAEKLVQEIRPTPSPMGGPSPDALQALTALGYPAREAEAALREVLGERTIASVEEVVRATLRKLTQSPPKSSG